MKPVVFLSLYLTAVASAFLYVVYDSWPYLAFSGAAAAVMFWVAFGGPDRVRAP